MSLLVACGGDDAPPAPTLPAWDRRLPEASTMGVRRGLTPTRSIVHLHSPYSHDACDNSPRADDGTPNEPCLQDLRAALCDDRIDVAALTDHDDTMADEDFPTLFSMRDGDEPVMNGSSEQVGSRIHCPDGHVVTVGIGGENTLMPILLERHVAGTIPERHALYNGDDATAAAAYRTAGGLVWVAHTEQHEVAELTAVGVDGLELYNLHANLDPTIRERDLGLPASGAITAVVEFADANPGHPEPDLALISFLTPNQPALERWNTLLGMGLHVSATAGTDAHQNALPVMLADGERGDSYRRMMRWFANIALVTDPRDVAQVRDAFRTGRAFTVFEMFGTPVGFDAYATSGATTVELGGTAHPGDLLTVALPCIAVDASLPVPEMTTTILRIDGTGAHAVMTTSGTAACPATPAATAPLQVTLDAAGAYRVEISITPRHLGPYLGDLERKGFATQAFPWIYSNPIYVE